MFFNENTKNVIKGRAMRNDILLNLLQPLCREEQAKDDKAILRNT